MATVAARVTAALALDGFTPRVRAGGLSFRGTVELRGAAIPLRLDYEGLDFSSPPTVVVERPELLGDRVVPHLDERDVLCVFNARQYVADRYLAAEQARGIIARAAEVLEEGLQARGVAEVAEEFPSHWGGTVVGIEFDLFEGTAEACRDSRGALTFRRRKGLGRSVQNAALVLKTAVPLSFRADQQRPTTLGEAVAWARSWDADLGERMFKGLVALSPRNPYVFLYAPNGVIGFELDVASKGPKVASVLTTRGGWATLLRGSFGRNLPIRRVHGRRVDMEYVLGTNSASGTAPLAGKNIALVGCGAIGGYLSVALAQLGAGLAGGTLTLVDDEVLDNRNVARHRLGSDSIGLAKAEGCRKEIDRTFPGLKVAPIIHKAQDCRVRLSFADLVIDATGEQAVGDMLNAWRLEGAPFALLHVWVEGNGAAVQSYFSSDPEFGCYRCLQPDHAAAPRFPVLRPDADLTMATGCGEAPFSPYGPAAPMAASALASQHAADWASGHPRWLLRTIRLDYEETQERKPANPTRSSACPACAEAR